MLGEDEVRGGQSCGVHPAQAALGTVTGLRGASAARAAYRDCGAFVHPKFIVASI